MDHSFSTYAKFSKKLTFLTLRYAHEQRRAIPRARAHLRAKAFRSVTNRTVQQGIRNVSFSDSVAYVLTE